MAGHGSFAQSCLHQIPSWSCIVVELQLNPRAVPLPQAPYRL